MQTVWRRGLAAAVACVVLAGCASDGAVESRGRVAGGTFLCSGGALPGATLLVFPDGVYELRWRDVEDRRATGWLEDAGGVLKATSGPLQGAVGRRAAGGLTFATDPGVQLAVAECGAMQP